MSSALNKPSYIFEVPSNISKEQIQRFDSEIVATYGHTYSIHNEIPDIHQFTIEWNSEAIALAKKNVLSVLRKWDGERPQQFVLIFTNSSQNRLMEIGNLTYFIEDKKVRIENSQCLPELYNALTGTDVLRMLEPILDQPQSRYRPVIAIRRKPFKLDALVKEMGFKTFENDLDRPPTIHKYDLSKKTMTHAFKWIFSRLCEELKRQKNNLHSYKLSFTLPQSAKISIRTTREHKLLNIKVCNMKNNEKEVDYFLSAIKRRGFSVSYMGVLGSVNKV